MNRIPVVPDLKSASELLISRARWYEDRAHELRVLACWMSDVPRGSDPEEAIRQLLFSARFQ